MRFQNRSQIFVTGFIPPKRLIRNSSSTVRMNMKANRLAAIFVPDRNGSQAFRSQKRDARRRVGLEPRHQRSPRITRGLSLDGGDDQGHRILLKALFGWPRPLCGHASSDCTSSSLRVLIDLAFRNFGEGFVRLFFFGKRAFQKPDSLV